MQDEKSEFGVSMESNNVWYKVLRGNCFLFLGAGFSYEAVNKSKNRFPNASKLSKEIQDKIPSIYDPTLTLKDSSQDYIDEHGKEKLFKLISDTFRVDETLKDYSIVSMIPWRRIYTTNYDDLIECAYRKNQKTIHSLLISDDPSISTPDDTTCIHLNGFVEKMSLQKFDAEFKLTETSYLTEMFTNSKWKVIFNADLRECDYVFFVGYSLYDIDIEKMLFENDSLRKKCIFITEETPSPRLERKLNKYGSVVKIGVSGFLDELNKAANEHHDIKKAFYYSNISKYETPIPSTEVTTDDIISLLLYGNEKVSLIKSAILNNDAKYYISRREINDLDFDLKRNSCVVIHSKLANGKSLFSLGALEHLKGLGYTPFILHDGKDISVKEIEEIKKENKPLIFIENYHRHLESLKLISSINTDNIKILLTSRTELHEIYIQELESLDLSVQDIDVNKLKDKEINEIIKIISENGLFGDKSNLSLKAKKLYLKNNLKSEFSSILGDILKAPQLKNRIDDLLNDVKENSEFEECILLCSIAAYLGHNLDDLDINTLTSVRRLSNVSFLKHETRAQIIEKTSSGLVILKNPVLAKHIIERKVIDNPQGFLDFIVGIYTKLNSYSYENKYKLFMRDINIFSNLLKIFGENNKGLINEFYERIRLLSDNSKNQHFWLQFAIAKLSVNDYPTADKFIETTYSLAKGRNYNHDWVNCQYSRLLIETASFLTDNKEKIEQLKKAHDLIINQENRHYPYRVACQYFTFLQDNERTLDASVKKAVATFLLDFDRKYTKTLSSMNNIQHPVMLKFKNKTSEFFKYNPNLK
ncbi:SIR2 family protein [Aeromonas media]|uniref:SIR2 family protein n=1 Tax=Aeromonas media TaxID=651 RepID=UPI00143D8E86|nr:SIR2 family protein [Aeromonas media]MBS4699087.1 SIR2 family protein [Aeromonas media]QIY85602.1 SIR2 family protein [Aeromonas hydrophila]